MIDGNKKTTVKKRLMFRETVVYKINARAAIQIYFTIEKNTSRNATTQDPITQIKITTTTAIPTMNLLSSRISSSPIFSFVSQPALQHE